MLLSLSNNHGIVLFCGIVLVLTGADAAIRMPTAQQQRTTTELIYSGRMIRYETQPMQYVNGKGQVISAKDAGAKTDFCVDMEGKHQANGAEYQRPNKHFFYKCNNGDEEVVACVGTDRTGGARIAVGDTLSMKGFEHQCQRMANGSVVYSQSHSCQFGGQEYPVGAEFMMGPLRAFCQEVGFKIIGCTYDIDGQKVNMAPGEQRDINNQRYLCTPSNSNNGQQLQQEQQQVPATSNINSSSSSPTSFRQQKQQQKTTSFSTTNTTRDQPQRQQPKRQPGCSRSNGQRMAEGELFQANHIRYKCGANGFLEIIGCFTGSGAQLAIGQDLVEKNMVYRCFRAEEAGKGKDQRRMIEYTEYACGYLGGPTCTPAPLSVDGGSQQSAMTSSNDNNKQQQEASTNASVAEGKDDKEEEEKEEKPEQQGFPAKKETTADGKGDSSMQQQKKH